MQTVAHVGGIACRPPSSRGRGRRQGPLQPTLRRPDEQRIMCLSHGVLESMGPSGH